uniref:hypothetical protein n=1 Tax=Thaumasiovibrio occultus TaxID=1891184 RepID=UPI000B35EAE6|nr:hypothetical protein [Thaumasiovibrio occultus]
MTFTPSSSITPWHEMTPSQRAAQLLQCEIIAPWRAVLDDDIAHNLAAMSQPVTLASPTGEANSWRLVPFGHWHLDCALGGERLALVISARLLVAGNTLSWDSQSSPQFQMQMRQLSQHLPDGVLYAAQHYPLSAVVCLGDQTRLHHWREQVVNSSAAIVPLLHFDVNKDIAAACDPLLADHWVHERTQTINLTAIGGNTALLSRNNEG